MNIFNKYDFILASKSPRRKELLEKLYINPKIEVRNIDEVYPKKLSPDKIVEFLANLKSERFKDINIDQILITADTIVYFKNKILGKPKNAIEAKEMLNYLSGKINQVFTGVCIKTHNKKIIFSEKTDVYFKKLSQEEINFYIDKEPPFDKAGSYGIQDWIGMIGIEKIIGCYYNVMGLPLTAFYKNLNSLIK